MEQAIVNLLKVAFTELFQISEDTTPEMLVDNICRKAELELSPDGKQELINHLNIL